MKMGRKTIVVSVTLIIILTAVMVLSCSKPESNVSGQISPPAPVETPVPESVSRPTPSGLVPRISIEELLGKMESNANIVVVDARPKVEYDAGHIKGAVSAPLAVILEGQWAPPPEKEVIFY